MQKKDESRDGDAAGHLDEERRRGPVLDGLAQDGPRDAKGPGACTTPINPNKLERRSLWQGIGQLSEITLILFRVYVSCMVS